ncbi:restriction endonuclease subunit S [Blautia sp.]|uniref:restriction endonuclease subunit S n=1 Tax=Blautia sp. TaxID=1955243 RepID=UPI0035219530
MEVMMKELGEIITGNTPSKKTEAFWSSEDICFIKPDIIADDGINEIVDSNEYISEDARKKARVVGKNSIFITCIGSIGKIGIASDGEYAFNQQINAIIPNDRVQPKYLAYNLLFNKPRLVAIANAPVVPIINKSQFGEFTVNIETDIDRQCEIVDVLDKFTQIIQQRNKEISALDELIKARFVELFGNPEINDMHWDEHKLSDELSVIGGYAFKSDSFQEDGIPVLRIGNINAGVFRPINLVFWKKDDTLFKYLMYPGDLVMSLTGTVGKDDYGNVCILGSEYEMYYLNQRNAKLELKDGLDKYYLAELLKFPQIKKRLTGISRGVRQANISNKDILDLSVPIPPMKLQQQFADFVTQVDKSKVINQLLQKWNYMCHVTIEKVK